MPEDYGLNSKKNSNRDPLSGRYIFSFLVFEKSDITSLFKHNYITLLELDPTQAPKDQSKAKIKDDPTAE
jgi:hypothetical protein